MEQLPVTSVAAHSAAQRQKKNPDVRLRRIQRLEGSRIMAGIYIFCPIITEILGPTTISIQKNDFGWRIESYLTWAF